MADLMVQQQFWAGGSHHVEMQSSPCLAEPRLLELETQLGLFEVKSEPSIHRLQIHSRTMPCWINFALCI